MLGIIRKNLSTLREELGSYSSSQRAFIFFAMLCGFFICCEYSLVRPICNSIFIAHYTTKWLPYAWIAIVPFNFLMVSLYNRLIPKWGSKRLFVYLILVVMASNLFIAFFLEMVPGLSFVFYMWKEVYVLLMFQLVWSVIHSNVNLKKAKYLYGIFYGIGGLGSMLGVSFPGFFAVAYGSENLLFLTMPIYLLLLGVYWKMCSFCQGDVPNTEREEHGGFLHGLKLIKGSRFLVFALLIVVFMQMITAVVDFQFNDVLERFFPDRDTRTEYSARVLGAMHTITVAMQFIGTYVIIKWMGFRNAHYFVPAALAVFAGLLAVFPVFPIASLMFVSCKCLDFSVFGVVKEMLYVPLKPDEKFRAKAVIDVFAYRTSKAFASLLIILVTSLVSTNMLSWLSILIAFAWILSVSYGMREYQKQIEVESA
ncbi:MAG: Npt1/Npt2 family nucleotide transporter [Simkaniaceae bacterium]|nr:Npt1/Npt2 family nucleotide transporter [Candidatus Sacchlamyda saccharinae]